MGNTGVPGETMSAAAVRMEVVAVNDAPTITLPPESARTTAEDATLDLGALRIGDVDAGADDVTVELSVEHGSIAVLSTQPPRGQTAVSLTDTLIELNDALSTLWYLPDVDWHGVDVLTVTVRDNSWAGVGGPQETTRVMRVVTTAVNDAPYVRLFEPSQTTDEDTPLAVAGVEVDDTDVDEYENTMALMDVTVTAARGRPSVAAVVHGVVATTDAGTADGDGDDAGRVLRLRGTRDALNSALRTLVFTPDAHATGAAALTVAVNDLGNTGAGGALSDAETVAIDVVAVNDAPVVVQLDPDAAPQALELGYEWALPFISTPPTELARADGTTSDDAEEAAAEVASLVQGAGRPDLHLLRTYASHRDEVQTVTTLADSPLSGHFSLGLDLSWLGDGGGGDVGAAVTGRIDHAALPQTADERLTHEPGSNLGESMQTHINALLARLADEATEGPARDMVARMSVDVTRDDRPPNGGFVWSITFHNAPFDLTPLSVEDTSGLEGDGAAVWIDTVVQGNGLGGDDGATRVDPAGTGVQTFTLLDDSPGFAGGWTLTLVTDHVETTTAIDAHAVAMTADEAADKLGSSMESKLRTLPSVRHKAFFVTREAVLSDPGDDVLGYVWTVTFFDWPTEWPVLVPRLVNVVGDEPRVSASPVMTGTEIQTFTLRDTAPGFSGGWTLALDLQLWEGEIETSALIDAAAVPATADEVNGGGVGLDIGESLESKLRALPNFGAMELDVSRSEIRTDPGGGGGSGDLIGYTWTVTFHNAPRHLPTLLPQRTTLVGTDPNLHIKARTVLHASHGAPGGTFTVTLDGDETEPLAFDATAAEVRGAILALPSAIAADLGLGSVAVARWPRDREGGHAWYVAITEENDNAALAMAANGAGLSHAAVGASASMTLVHRGGVRGVFTLAHEGMLAARVLRADGTDVTTRGASSEGLGRLRVTGTVADVATALRHVMYTPTLDWHGRVTVAVRVRDMGNTGVPGETMSAAAVRMEVVAVNDAPTITLPPESARTTAEDATLDLGALRIGDVDAGADDVTVELSVEHGSIAVLSTQPPRGQTAASPSPSPSPSPPAAAPRASTTRAAHSSHTRCRHGSSATLRARSEQMAHLSDVAGADPSSPPPSSSSSSSAAAPAPAAPAHSGRARMARSAAITCPTLQRRSRS
uniref:Cadherin domain-containing protein n=1 Tax=Bicosoecida sp. CB-2014 TaxID=1486930 RepID=A0A7S1G6J1_9STRA